MRLWGACEENEPLERSFGHPGLSLTPHPSSLSHSAALLPALPLGLEHREES